MCMDQDCEKVFSWFSAVLLGVPTTSRILTADSQKLSFSILRKVPFLIFWLDIPPRRTSSAHVACSRAGTWAEWADVVRRWGVSYVDKIHIFEILMKNCSKYVSASQIGWNFFKSGHPYCTTTHLFLSTHHNAHFFSIKIRLRYHLFPYSLILVKAIIRSLTLKANNFPDDMRATMLFVCEMRWVSHTTKKCFWYTYMDE